MYQNFAEFLEEKFCTFSHNYELCIILTTSQNKYHSKLFYTDKKINK